MCTDPRPAADLRAATHMLKKFGVPAGDEDIPLPDLVAAISAAYNLALSLDAALTRRCLVLEVDRPVPRVLFVGDPNAGGGRARQDYLAANPPVGAGVRS